MGWCAAGMPYLLPCILALRMIEARASFVDSPIVRQRQPYHQLSIGLSPAIDSPSVFRRPDREPVTTLTLGGGEGKRLSNAFPDKKGVTRTEQGNLLVCRRDAAPPAILHCFLLRNGFFGVTLHLQYDTSRGVNLCISTSVTTTQMQKFIP